MPDDLSPEELVNQAPKIDFCGQIPFGKYFKMGISKGSTWQFYNVLERKWRFIPTHKEGYGNNEHSVLLRDGWIIRRLEAYEQPYSMQATFPC